MNAFVLQTLLLLAIVFAVGVLIGLMLRRWRRGAMRRPSGTAGSGTSPVAKPGQGGAAGSLPPLSGNGVPAADERPPADGSAEAAAGTESGRAPDPGAGAPVPSGDTGLSGSGDAALSGPAAQAAEGAGVDEGKEVQAPGGPGPSAPAMAPASGAPGPANAPPPAPEVKSASPAGVADAAAAPPGPEEGGHPGRRPPKADAPEAGGADNLKLLKGIGPQNEERLHALGIFHFRQIAEWTEDEARWVGSYLAFPGRIEREDWIGQAKALLAGTSPEDLKRPSPRRRG